MKLPLKIQFLVLAFLSAVSYCLIAYSLPRSNFYGGLALYSILFACFGGLNVLSYKIQLKYLLIAGVLFRLLLLFSFPELSNDFYRFVWDGRLIVNGMSPYVHTPNELISTSIIPNQGNWKTLMDGMGSLSAENNTSYLPVNQLFFYLAALFSNENLLLETIFLRLFIIAADLGIVFLGIRLLKYFKLPARNILLFALNPFVIIEFPGNLHFESVMIFFFLAGVYLYVMNKTAWAGVLVAVGIGVKLMPLMFLPLFLRFGKIKKLLLFYTFMAIAGLVIILPLVFSFESTGNFLGSVNLWFQSFEFNASLYNIARYISFQKIGHNIFYEYSWVFPALSILIVLVVTAVLKGKKYKNLFAGIVAVFVLYLLISRIVHPWYLLTPLVFSIFLKTRFMLVWSFTAFLSYYAYSNPSYNESYWLLGVEYMVVLLFFILETTVPKKMAGKIFLSQ